MMRRYRIRLRRVVAALAASAIALAVGCSADEEPPDEPRVTGYQQPPDDLCEQVQFDELGRRWELTVPPAHEPALDYRTERVWWYVRCGFAGQAEGGRFETEFGEFQPTGAATFWVYHEVDDAIEKYDQDAASYFERPEEGEPAEVTGWWDTGVSVALAEELDPDNFTLGDFEVTGLDHRLLVRHENLVALMYLDARSPTEDADAAAGLLEEIAAATLDEAAGRLPRTE